VTLKTGSNIIVLGSDSGWAPYIDKIAFSLKNDNAVRIPNVSRQMEKWYSLGGVSIQEPYQSGIYIHGNQKTIYRTR
jgi:hypothetical protein